MMHQSLAKRRLSRNKSVPNGNKTNLQFNQHHISQSGGMTTHIKSKKFQCQKFLFKDSEVQHSPQYLDKINLARKISGKQNRRHVSIDDSPRKKKSSAIKIQVNQCKKYMEGLKDCYQDVPTKQPYKNNKAVQFTRMKSRIAALSEDSICELDTPSKFKQHQYFPKYLIKLQVPMIKNTENVSTEDKYLPEHLSYKEKSSKRSLLTEKLKNIESLSSQMGCGDDFEYTNGKILIKQNQIMKQLKKHTRITMTQPAYGHSQYSDLTSEQNKKADVYSQQYEKNQTSKDNRTSRKKLLGKMLLKANGQRQRKAKRDLSGCSKCQVY